MVHEIEGTCLKLSGRYPGAEPRTRLDELILDLRRYVSDTLEKVHELFGGYTDHYGRKWY